MPAITADVEHWVSISRLPGAIGRVERTRIDRRSPRPCAPPSAFRDPSPPPHRQGSRCVAALVGLTIGVAPAAAKSAPPCWKTLINDWYDGRIDGTYPIHCYRDALQHLPTDVDTYSSARDDIQAALQKRITQGTQQQTTTTTATTTTGSTGGGKSGGSSGGGKGGGTSGGTGGSTGGGKSGGGTSTGPIPSGGPDAGGGGKSASGPIGGVFDATKPSSADSLPIPLIVLGGVALLLMALGGAGFLARRTRLRRCSSPR